MNKILIFMMMTCLILTASDANDTKSNNKSLNKQFLTAANSGNIQLLKALLQKHININIQDHRGRTALMIATHNNDIPTSKLLIVAGADVNIMDNIQDNPFLYAGAEGYIEILKLTIDAGANPHLINRYGGTALIPASEHGYIEVVKLLLSETKTDVNLINNLGWTALLEAIILNTGGYKQQEVIKLLIAYGADVNIKDFNGISPLEHTRRKGFKSIEKILLKAGAK
mgnify:CR=1 FL=1